jgi:hypothetical protein
MQAIYGLAPEPRHQQLELQDIVVETALVLVLQHKLSRSLFERARGPDLSRRRSLRVAVSAPGDQMVRPRCRCACPAQLPDGRRRFYRGGIAGGDRVPWQAFVDPACQLLDRFSEDLGRKLVYDKEPDRRAR